MEKTKKFSFRHAAALVLALVMTLSVMTVMASAVSNWPIFRSDLQNSSTVDAPTPRTLDEAYLKWAVKLGTGWSAAPSVPVIYKDYMYVMNGMNGGTLYKMELSKGTIVAEQKMAAAPGFAVVPPMVVENMVFCELGTGVVQAFDAETLTPLWTYKDSLGGQANTALYYYRDKTTNKGYVYTGFWNGETQDANFVCLSTSIDDETVSQDGENVVKSAEWTKTVAGGFYWAGIVAENGALIFGTDDGTTASDSETAHLYSVNPVNGDVHNELTIIGDQRSGIVNDIANSGYLYFTTKAGYCYGVQLNDDGSLATDSVMMKKVASQSTATPIAYGDYVYVCGGSGVVSGSGGAGNFFVLDSTDKLNVVASAPLLAYPQCPALLSTHYLDDDGLLYFYCNYNGKPGGLTLLTVKPDDPNTLTKTELFTPEKAMQQFCICAPICDENGTIYYKNDSCYLMAVGTNNAYATDITAAYGDTAAATIKNFSAATLSYEVVVPAKTKTVTIAAEANEGGSITVNGTADSAEVKLAEDGTGTATVVATNDGNTRTYTLSIRWASDNANLGVLQVNASNSYSSFKTLSPAFSANTTRYLVENIKASSFANVWPEAADSKATVKVYAVSGVSASRINDAETGEINVTANQGHPRYAIYYADKASTAANVRIEVTAEDGVTVKNYYVTLYNDAMDTLNRTISLMDKGTVAVNAAEIKVGDRNGDGQVSIDEALYSLHQSKYSDGTSGYATAVNQYGTYITKLWGDESGNFGYYVGNAMAMSLDETVAEDAHLVAYITANTYPNNDAYSYFEQPTVTTQKNHMASLKLIAQNGYDASYNPVFASYAGATLKVYEDAALTTPLNVHTITDSGNGVYSVLAEEEGTFYIVATAAENAIVPTVCKLTVGADTQFADVAEKINNIGTVTAESGDAIAAARAAYDALSDTQKAQLSNYDVLEAAEKAYADIVAAAAVEAKIAALDPVTKESSNAIFEARTAYDALTDEQKELVPNLDDLVAAEKKFYDVATGTSKVQNPAREDNNKKNNDEEETTGPSNGFTDVSKNSWYYDAVNAAVSSGLMTGVGNNNFAPNASVTRGMIVTILARMDGEKTAGTPWYAAGQTWAKTNGVSDGSNMTGTLTREQLAAMLYRYAQYKGHDVATSNTLAGYADAASVSAFAQDALRWANSIGLIQGRNGRLAPQGTASRAELATILDRFMTIFG